MKGLKPAPVLFYGDDPVAVFFMHIQGSGRIIFDDGKIERVASAGQNGWPYTAIGKTLIADRGAFDPRPDVDAGDPRLAARAF